MKKTIAEFIEELKLGQDKPIKMWDYQQHTWHIPNVRKYKDGDIYDLGTLKY